MNSIIALKQRKEKLEQKRQYRGNLHEGDTLELALEAQVFQKQREQHGQSYTAWNIHRMFGNC